ncbi:MAG: RES family NAD+ phosphorylase [Lachnospiraceae bacterium]|nr:RES family NAD+ phosphorylase [Lachnospiraceae bacterium]
MGGLSSAAFYGAGRAVEAVKSSVRSGCEGGRGATFEGTIYRSVNKDFAPLEMSDYTINSNHRYTGKGMPGLYFSSGEKIVKAELGNYDVYDYSNRVMYSYDVKLTNMLDGANPSVRSKLGISLDSIIGESYDVTHAIGRYAYINEYSGIIAPSARADGGVNIILFNTKEVK